MFNIVPVRDAKQLHRFIKFPWKIYKKDSPWVPPLISDQKKFFSKKNNPFFKHSDAAFFLALDSNHQPVGRIAAIYNKLHLDVYNDNRGFFGFFECIRNQTVANKLLDAAADWLKQKGLDKIRGPMNYSVNDDCGLLVEGYHLSPSIMMPYNPSYYLDLIRGWGLEKSQDLLAFLLDFNHISPEAKYARKVLKAASRNKKIRVRNADLKRLDKEVPVFLDIYRQAWSENWSAIPMEFDEMMHIVEAYKAFMDPRLIHIAEYEGKPVGMTFALPDLFPALKLMKGRITPWGLFRFLRAKRKVDGFRIVLMGVLKEYRNIGVEAALYRKLFFTCQETGYKRGEFSWVLESNQVLIHQLQQLNCEAYKRYRIFDRDL